MTNNPQQFPQEIFYFDDMFSLHLCPLKENDAEIIHNAVIDSLEILKPFMDWSHRELSIKNQLSRI